MLKAQFYSEQRIALADAPMPIAGPGEVVVQVAACCVCGSDLRTFLHGNKRVKEGTTLGHEISGTIVACGDGVSEWKAGDRIALGADIPCESCEWCDQGLPNSCSENLAIGYQFEGGFAEYIRLDKRVVRRGPMAKLPDSVSFEAAALAEPVACCLNGYEKIVPFFSEMPRRNLSVVIFGAGPIGSILALLAEHYGIESVVTLDVREDRLQWLKERDVSETLLLDKAGDWKKKLDALAGHPRLIFTACSVLEAQQAAIEAMGPSSALNFFGGLPAGKDLLTISSNLLHYQQSVMTGSHGSTPKQVQTAIEILAKREKIFSELISHTFELRSIGTAFETALSRDGLKILIRP